VTPGQHLPPDHSRGDESTVGGYAAVHARPAALAGRDGMSYSLEILTDLVTESAREERFGAYLLFVRWKRIGEPGVAGHLESAFLTRGATAAQAKRTLGEMPLTEAQRVLDALVGASTGERAGRRWWDVMHDESADR
jgi:hypothetical protein